ncbi:MAG: four helix bundle protein, partial [Bryobacteraceae bacterium]
MGKINSFRDLEVWRLGMDLVEGVYRVSAAFPKTEIYGLTSQVRRAAVSAPSNIAEGHTRASTKEYLNHLSMAQASLAEVSTQLEIAMRLGYIPVTEMMPKLDEIGVLGRMLFALRNA